MPNNIEEKTDPIIEHNHDESKLGKGQYVFELKNVTKNFKVRFQEINVLKGIDLKVGGGELMVILGPSGSGKSTMLNIMLGLEPPSSGEVIFLGEDVSRAGEDHLADFRKNHVGMIHQQANWIKSLSVLQNVAFPLLLHGVPKHEAMSIAREKLRMINMEAWANFSPTELSSGQQQKISLARSLVTDPHVIIADEP
ncbi:MAG: ATP-binding cassette domain-containing protein, partial [Bdellovibrionales bacterium]|nr:ATP-binding cassette domain-containing protein [Bdellovibrionales bacterium]